MSIWVVVGGQFGSEGKGKVAAWLVFNEHIDIAIRCGGPNSGHSLLDASGRSVVMKQLPTAVIRKETRLLIPAGGLVDLDILRSEIEHWQLSPDRVGIDRHCTIIEEVDKRSEASLQMDARIGSTLSGVGSALSRRVLRTDDVTLAKDVCSKAPWLRAYLTDVSDEVNAAIDADKNLLVEGTQGFGLSNYHSRLYPKATSRDTTAAGFIAEVGISPRAVTHIVVVLRTFPIRVAGQSGTLKEEISWEQLQSESGCPGSLREYTTVTKKLRRVGRFDAELARAAVRINRPDYVVLNFLDHLDYRDHSISDWNLVQASSKDFVLALEAELKVPVRFCGTGPNINDVIDRCANPMSIDLNINTSRPVVLR